MSIVTFELVLSHLRKRDFAVLSTIGKGGRPHSVGVNYGVSEPGRAFVIYVMTRKHLQKARNIAENPNISLVVPLTRRLLWFLPPPTIQLHGQAQIVDWADEEGTDVFRRFWMGRRILKAYRESHQHGETRICFTEDHSRSRGLHVHGRLQHLATPEAHGIGSGQGRHPSRVSVIGIFSLTGPPWGDIVHFVVGVPQQAASDRMLISGPRRCLVAPRSQRRQLRASPRSAGR